MYETKEEGVEARWKRCEGLIQPFKGWATQRDAFNTAFRVASGGFIAPVLIALSRGKPAFHAKKTRFAESRSGLEPQMESEQGADRRNSIVK